MYKEMLLEKNKRLITCSRGSKKTRASDKMAIWLKRAKGWKLLFYLFIFPGRSKPTTSSLMSFHHQRCFHDISILPDKWWIISFVTAQRCSQCCRLDEHFLIQRIHWTLKSLETPMTTKTTKLKREMAREANRTTHISSVWWGCPVKRGLDWKSNRSTADAGKQTVTRARGSRKNWFYF